MILDFHAHIYPTYSLSEFFSSAFRTLSHNSNKSVAQKTDSNAIGLILTERSQEKYFGSLQKKAHPELLPFSLRPLPGFLEITEPHTRAKLYVFPGQQISTSEKLEVHLLFSEKKVPEGLPLIESIEAALEIKEGIVALPWSPGKWWGARGRLIATALDLYSKELWISEPALRPRILPTIRSSKVLYGTDPLPLAGEELRVGTYATQLDLTINEALPHGGIPEYLKKCPTLSSLGERLSSVEVATRLLRMRLNKYRRKPTS